MSSYPDPDSASPLSSAASLSDCSKYLLFVGVLLAGGVVSDMDLMRLDDLEAGVTVVASLSCRLCDALGFLGVAEATDLRFGIVTIWSESPT